MVNIYVPSPHGFVMGKEADTNLVGQFDIDPWEN